MITNKQWADAEGIIFPMIANNNERYIKTHNFKGFITIGIDWGDNKSYHSITATKISDTFDRVQYLKHSKLKATGTDTEDIMPFMVNFIKEVYNRYGHITCIFPDAASQVLKNTLIKELSKADLYFDVKDSLKIEIHDRIHLLTIYHNLDKISYVENECNDLIEAVSTCLFDEKADKDRWIDDGQVSDIDSMDSSCYSWTYFHKQLSIY